MYETDFLSFPSQLVEAKENGDGKAFYELMRELSGTIRKGNNIPEKYYQSMILTELFQDSFSEEQPLLAGTVIEIISKLILVYGYDSFSYFFDSTMSGAFNACFIASNASNLHVGLTRLISLLARYDGEKAILYVEKMADLVSHTGNEQVLRFCSNYFMQMMKFSPADLRPFIETYDIFTHTPDTITQVCGLESIYVAIQNHFDEYIQLFQLNKYLQSPSYEIITMALKISSERPQFCDQKLFLTLLTFLKHPAPSVRLWCLKSTTKVIQFYKLTPELATVKRVAKMILTEGTTMRLAAMEFIYACLQNIPCSTVVELSFMPIIPFIVDYIGLEGEWKIPLYLISIITKSYMTCGKIDMIREHLLQILEVDADEILESEDAPIFNELLKEIKNEPEK